ncbi:uncharacterized protein LOC132260703 [Phlebotomus argentipes]|uniref:uncharacterized protein LOC132260703 n=1 Tax=Phlebotomus argentipes TaxID=94469 RepID=UPI002892A884|nr:uncharacterized protein LOC132260703 [Phlebotomus argentipes]
MEVVKVKEEDNSIDLSIVKEEYCIQEVENSWMKSELEDADFPDVKNVKQEEIHKSQSDKTKTRSTHKCPYCQTLFTSPHARNHHIKTCVLAQHRKLSCSAEKKFGYSPEMMRVALKAIDDGMPVTTAAKHFQIPRSTLRNKITGKSPMETPGHRGYHSALGRETEDEIVRWVLSVASAGFPVTKDGLQTTAEKIILSGSVFKPDEFKNTRPSKRWFYSFLQRHPEVGQKRAEYAKRARWSASQRKLKKWFGDVEGQLGENADVLRHPERIFCLDDFPICLAPTGKLIISSTNRNVFVESSKCDKDIITTLFVVRATGEFAPPLTVFKSEEMPSEAEKFAPLNWRIGSTESGLMQASAFYEYMEKDFLPFLHQEEIGKPVVVFLDGRNSHLTMHLSKLCSDCGIILIALCPNATDLLQPLDGAVFQPLKSTWRSLKREWRATHGREVGKFDIPDLLNTFISDNQISSDVRSGFVTTGLFPFDSNAVDYSKVPKITQKSGFSDDQADLPEQNFSEEDIQRIKTYVESKIDPNIVSRFENTRKNGQEWSGEANKEALFRLWNDIVNDLEGFSSRKSPLRDQKVVENSLKEDVRWPNEAKKRKMEQVS